MNAKSEKLTAKKMIALIDVAVEQKGECPFEILAQLVDQLHERVELEYIIHLCERKLKPFSEEDRVLIQAALSKKH